MEVITNMEPPNSPKEVIQFIGVVNNYRNMSPRKSHMLAPLTRITPNKVKFKWTKIEQNTFDKIKRIVAHYTLLTYPDFNKTFKIHTDARNYQLGAVISQKFKPIPFYSRT